MNIIYNLNPDTGLMRLEFKKNLFTAHDFTSVDRQKQFEQYILPMLAANNKLVLTGSLSLKLLGFEPMDDIIGDFDLGLIDEFTEEDYNILKNFFGLRDTHSGYNQEEMIEKSSFDPKAHMWQFSKTYSEPGNDYPDLNREVYFKLDIFNDEIIRLKDTMTIFYNDFEVKLVHPSITYSYRMRYALDIRSSVTFKYWKRMEAFMDNAKLYYHNLRAIQKMLMRVEEHNANVKDDKEKLVRLKELISRRDYNANSFMEKIMEVANEDNSDRGCPW